MMKYKNKIMLVAFGLLVYGQVYSMAPLRRSIAAASAKIGEIISPLESRNQYLAIKKLFISADDWKRDLRNASEDEKREYEPRVPTQVREKLEILFKTEGVDLFFTPKFASYPDEVRETLYPYQAILALGGTKALLLMNSTAIEAFEGRNSFFTEAMMIGTAKHELGHVVHRHHEKILIFDGMRTPFNSLTSFGAYKGVMGYGEIMNDSVFQGLIECEATCAGAFIFYLGKRLWPLIRNAYKRHNERQADQYALQHGDAVSIEARIDFFAYLMVLDNYQKEKDPSFERDEDISYWQRTHPTHKERMITCFKALKKLEAKKK